MLIRNVLKNYTVTFAKDGAATGKFKVNAGAYIGIVLDDTISNDSARADALNPGTVPPMF